MLFPMLAKQAEATSLTAFINDDEWVFEQKLDGHRVLLCSPGGDFPPVAMTRNGTPYTRKLPEAIRNFRFPDDTAPHRWILDGELVDGTFYVFDMPQSPYIDKSDALHVRRSAMETLFRAMRHPFKLVPQAKDRAAKIRLAEIALRDNYEGLVIKRRRSAYISGGRTEAWLKLKFVTTAECVVLDVRDDGKESIRLGMYGPTIGAFGGAIKSRDIVMHDVGRASLIGKEKNGTINKGDVVEVRYLYTGKGNRLYQPTILHKRDDKKPEECTTGQLKFVNKAVLESL